MPISEHSVTIVIPGDLHLTERELDNCRVGHWVVDEVNGLIRPDFVQFIGDNVQDATDEQFHLFSQLRARLQVPHFALVGDHDVKGDPTALGFQRHVGPRYGATSLRGFRFIRLNTQESRPLGLSAEQIAWFRGEMDSALAEGERAVIFQHNYPYQIWESFDGPCIDAWRSIVQTRRVEAIVCGHTHYWQIANDGRNVAIATRSIGDPEGGPPGYTVLHLQGDDLAVAFRSVEDRGPVVLVTHPRERIVATGPRHIVQGADRVIARIWSDVQVNSVRSRIDNEGDVELQQHDAGAWSAPLRGDRLSKGEHLLEIVAETVGGTVASQRIEFIVDPTGRFTAVPEARPVVASTAFC